MTPKALLQAISCQLTLRMEAPCRVFDPWGLFGMGSVRILELFRSRPLYRGGGGAFDLSGDTLRYRKNHKPWRRRISESADW